MAICFAVAAHIQLVNEHRSYFVVAARVRVLVKLRCLPDEGSAASFWLQYLRQCAKFRGQQLKVGKEIGERREA